MNSNAFSTSKRIAPGPRGYPIVGSLPMLLRDPLRFLSKSRDHGEVVRVDLGVREMYVVHHPDHVKYVMHDKMNIYHKSPFFLSKVQTVLGKSVGALGGGEWAARRRFLMPSFRPQSYAPMATAITEVTALALDRWRSAARAGTPLDMKIEMMQLTQAVIIKTIFGLDSDDGAMLTDSVETLRQTIMRRMAMPFDPPEWFPTPSNRRYAKALHTLDTFILGVIEKRRRSLAERPAGDLLSLLLLTRDEQTGEPLDGQQIRDEMMSMFIAGLETVGIPLGWICYFLSMYPDVLRKLEEEIDTVLGGRVPTYEDLSKLVYTRMVIDEAMRVYPPGWAWFRAPIVDDEIGGCLISAGTLVMICPYTTHRHPDFWENPEAFDPERFAPQLAAKHHPFAYFPFSNGPRVCLARGLSLMEMKLIVSMVVQAFRLRRVPGIPVEPQAVSTLVPRHGLPMTLHPRS